MASPNQSVQTAPDNTYDQFVEIAQDDQTLVVWAVRPITLTQGDGPVISTVDNAKALYRVNVVGTKDLVVYGDQVTIDGTLRLKSSPQVAALREQLQDELFKPADARNQALIASLRRSIAALPRGNVTIVARELISQGPASVDASGEPGVTPGEDYGHSTPDVRDKDARELAADHWGPCISRDQYSTFFSPEDNPLGPPAPDGMSANRPGTNEPDPNSPLNGQPGANGGAGSSGGTILVRVGHVDPNAAVTLIASGAKGGDGRKGQYGAAGGAGAKGKGTSTCSIRYYHDGKTAPIPPGAGGRGGRGGRGGDAGRGGDGGIIDVAVRSGGTSQLGTPNGGLSAGPWGTRALGGDGGAGGQGGWFDAGVYEWMAGNEGYKDRFTKRNGVAGDKGDDGSTGLEKDAGGNYIKRQPAAGTRSDLPSCTANQLASGLTTPLSGYLMMLLERIQSDMLVSAGQPSDETTSRVAWLTDLLAGYVPTDASEINCLDFIRGQAQILAQRVTSGQDFFGHGPAFAPLGSMDLHENAFDAAVNALAALEKDYNAIVSDIAQRQSKSDQFAAAKTKLDGNAADSDKAAAEAERTFLALASDITAQQADIMDALHGFERCQERLTTAIKKACGCSLEDAVQALSQFAFFGEGGPQRAAMVISQVGGLVATGVSKCIEDDGTKVDKTYIIHQLTEVTDLEKAVKDESYTGTINGISLADPGAVKLLGHQKQLDDLCDKFWSYDGASELKDAFDTYVATMQKRNADILAYNESLTCWRHARASAAQARAGSARVDAEKANTAAPGEPTVAAQLARMVTRTKNDCIEHLYLASRAFWFWSLQPGDSLASVLKDFAVGQPLALTADALNAAKQQIFENKNKVTEKRLGDRGSGPDPRGDGRGIVIDFSEQDHPELIDTLRARGTATFHLKPGRRTYDPSNKFTQHGDVRLLKVRPWVYGATTDDNVLEVDIVHTGRERLVHPDTDQVHVVRHPPVTIEFRYDMSHMTSPRPPEPPKPGASPASASETARTPTVPSLQCLHGAGDPSDPELFTLSSNGQVLAAAFGPFTTWRVTIKQRPGLDLTKINRLAVEFLCYMTPIKEDSSQ